MEPLHTVVETPEFQSSAARILSDQEKAALINHIAANPMAGDVIPGTGGARKLRFGFGGKGKSGGARVITFYTGPNIPTFLLAIFSKNQKINLSKQERNELKTVLSTLAKEYRARS